jgi:hypothetical protein
MRRCARAPARATCVPGSRAPLCWELVAGTRATSVRPRARWPRIRGLTVAQHGHTLCAKSANERHYHTLAMRRDRSCARIHPRARASAEAESGQFAGSSGSGETRTRTGDTTIFSRASTTGECALFAAESQARLTSPCCRGFPHFPRDCGPLRHTIANLCPNCSETRLRAPRRPRVARPGRDDLQGRATSQAPAPVTAHFPRRRRTRLKSRPEGCAKPGAGPCRSPQAWPLSGRL